MGFEMENPITLSLICHCRSWDRLFHLASILHLFHLFHLFHPPWLLFQTMDRFPHRFRYHSILPTSQRQPGLPVSLAMLGKFHQQHKYHKPMAVLLNAGLCAKCFIYMLYHETILEVGIPINSISQMGTLMLRNTNLCIKVHTAGVTNLKFNPRSA